MKDGIENPASAEAWWKCFRHGVLDGDEPEDLVEAMRLAFYSGFAAMQFAARHAAGLPGEAGTFVLACLDREVAAYFEEAEPNE